MNWFISLRCRQPLSIIQFIAPAENLRNEVDEDIRLQIFGAAFNTYLNLNILIKITDIKIWSTIFEDISSKIVFSGRFIGL